MPLEHNAKFKPNPDGNAGSRSNSYAQLMGKLQFIANAMRPDIAYMVSKLLSYTANPSMQHVTMLKRVLQYLSETRSYGITYHDVLGHPNQFFGYADASFTDADDLKSTTGYVFKMSSSVITWYSKKQSVTALSTMEAEYITLSEAMQEACWSRNLFEELGFAQVLPTTIFSDNKGSIAISKNPQFHKRAKHIGTQFHSVKEQVQEGVVTIESVRSQQQTADVLTKPLPWLKHKQHVSEMGLAVA